MTTGAVCIEGEDRLKAASLYEAWARWSVRKAAEATRGTATRRALLADARRFWMRRAERMERDARRAP
jgi:hypothetical protein